jgi:hypothetical protein
MNDLNIIRSINLKTTQMDPWLREEWCWGGGVFGIRMLLRRLSQSLKKTYFKRAHTCLYINSLLFTIKIILLVDLIFRSVKDRRVIGICHKYVCMIIFFSIGCCWCPQKDFASWCQFLFFSHHENTEGRKVLEMFKITRGRNGVREKEREKQPREMGCRKSDLESVSYNGP